jgi:hypothetical protein
MKLFKLDPMTLLVLVVALGVAVTMTTQASTQKAGGTTAIAMSDTATQMKVGDAAATTTVVAAGVRSQRPL